MLGEQTGQSGGPRLPGDTRAGSKAAMTAVAKACRKVTLPASTAAAGAGSGTASGSGAATATAGAGASASTATTLYDCQGRAGAIAAG